MCGIGIDFAYLRYLNFSIITLALVGVLLLLSGQSASAENPDEPLTDQLSSFSKDTKNSVVSIIEDVQQFCNSTIKLTDNAVSYLDLTANGKIDIIVIDRGSFECPSSGSNSDWCGSGGCRVHFIAPFDQIQGMVRGWIAVEDKNNDKYILLDLHGSACGKAGYQPCNKKLSLLDGKFTLEEISNDNLLDITEDVIVGNFNDGIDNSSDRKQYLIENNSNISKHVVTNDYRGSAEKLLIADVSKLPTGHLNIPRNCAHAVVSSPATEEGKYVKSKSWGVTSEVRLDELTFISFAGGMNWLTNNRCSRSESNIAVFKEQELKQIIYTSVEDDYLIGALQSIDDKIIQILSGSSRSPIAEIKIEQDTFNLQPVSSIQKFCNGSVLVPNIYNQSIKEARNSLINFGWEPKRHYNKPSYGALELREAGIIETKYCEPVGMAECELNYQNGSNELSVHTIGEYGRIVEYFAIQNCF